MMSIRTSTCYHTKINIANNAELHSNSQNILIIICEFQSKNTTEAYESKQKKFKISKLICMLTDYRLQTADRKTNLIDSNYSVSRSSIRIMILLQRISCFSFL